MILFFITQLYFALTITLVMVITFFLCICIYTEGLGSLVQTIHTRTPLFGNGFSTLKKSLNVLTSTLHHQKCSSCKLYINVKNLFGRYNKTQNIYIGSY